ncbi:MAG TPA: chemotaxis protein CheA [Clostridia bacterium]|nr:chemotaxis protein CheA [Clostridia bacterium]
MDMSQYLEIFIEETREHLQSLNQCLLQMEKNPQDGSMLNEIFRVAHTLKGMSGTMGFNRMSRLTHDMEDVLQALRSNEMKVSPELIDLLFKCLDALESYTTMVVETGSEGTEENAAIISSLAEMIKKKGVVSSNSANKPAAANTTAASPAGSAADLALDQYDINVINKAAALGNNAYQITVKLNKGCVLKSARAFIIFKTLERHSEIIKSEPKVQDIEDEQFDFEFTVAVLSKEDESVFDKDLNSIAEVDEVIIKLIKEKEAVDQPTSGETPDTDDQEAKSAAENADGDSSQVKTDTAAKKTKTGKTVRVDIDRLDVLLNLVSELIIQKTRLEGLEGIEKTQSYTEAVEYLERISTNLHDAVMKVRMVPVETVFNRFPRMIRDISKNLGKEVELKMSGEETELDRTVIDEIGDPLIHLLRNSCDHGIESIEQRKNLGKPEVGLIELKAYQDGNNVVIEVGDDGQGINIDKVKKKAIERGLINKDMAANLTKKDIIDFLFKPSFSTADKVTDLSGRGVGLDVVKTKIEALGGFVEVETELGKGSRFYIRLPLTLAIIQALLVMVGEEKYAIQLSSIHKITNIPATDVKLVQKQEVVMYRNTVIPIVRLDRVLEVPRESDEEPKNLTLVIVKKGERLTGLVVDKILGQQEIVQKSLGKFLSGIKIITSATILGDGNVALILDVNALAN